MGKPEDWMAVRRQIWRDGTAFMTPAARGVYMDICLEYFALGPLPNDDEALRGLGRCNEKTWRQVKAQVLAKFTERDGILFHERVDKERTEAQERFVRKSRAGEAGGKASGEARRNQSRSNRSTDASSTSQRDANTTYLEQSPNGDIHLPSGDGAKRPSKPKGTRLEIGWKPDPEVLAYGRTLNLTDAESHAELTGPFAEHFQGKDCKRPVKHDWPTAAKNWLRRGAPGIIARRPREQRSAQNARGNQSLTAARDSILAEAGVLGGSDNSLRDDCGSRAECAENSPGFAGAIIDADEWQRVPESSDGTEIADAPDAGNDRRPEGPAENIPHEADGLPRGRGSSRADNTAGNECVLASMERTERASGITHVSPADDADSLAIPAFLRRTA